MTEQRELRVSDGERQAAAERLRAAHDEGRLDFTEYDDRLAQAYSSVTYADLDRLFADLPARVPVAHAPGSVPAVRTRRAEVDTRTAFAALPLVLLWAAMTSLIRLFISRSRKAAAFPEFPFFCAFCASRLKPSFASMFCGLIFNA